MLSAMQLRRGDWITLGFALLVFAVFGLSRPILRLSTLSDGTLIDNVRSANAAATLVYPLNGANTALKKDDVIIAIEGRTLSAWAFDARRFAANGPPRSANELTYEIMRAGQHMIIAVTPRSYLQRRITADLANVFSALMYIGIGVYVFVRRPRLPSARALLMLGVAMACVNLFRAFDLEPTDVMYGALYGWSILMMTLVAG
jgi:hypothetical protein